MVGMMTIVVYSSGIMPSLNFILNVPMGLCNLPSNQLKRSIITWLIGSHSNTVSTTHCQLSPSP